MPKYTRYDIERYAPTSPGVYNIEQSSGRSVYIGEAENIQRRLLQHWRGYSDESDCINSNFPEFFDYEIVYGGKSKRVTKEIALKLLYDPICPED